MHIWDVIRCSGYYGLLGWMSLLLLVFLAVGVVARVMVRTESSAPELFFEIAQVQTFLFLLTNSLTGILYTFTCIGESASRLILETWTLSVSQILLSLCINSAVVVFLIAVVAKAARRSPALSFGAFLRVALLSIDFALLLAFISALIVSTGER